MLLTKWYQKKGYQKTAEEFPYKAIQESKQRKGTVKQVHKE